MYDTFNFCAVKKFLTENYVQFKAFPSEEEKLIKAVINHLQIRTSTQAIQNYLENFGFLNIVVSQMCTVHCVQMCSVPLKINCVHA